MTTIDNSLWEQFLLAPMYYIYWGIAIISSLVFTIQTIMLFVGFDTDADFGGGDVAFDVDGSGFGFRQNGGLLPTGFRLERSDSSSSL